LPHSLIQIKLGTIIVLAVKTGVSEIFNSEMDMQEF